MTNITSADFQPQQVDTQAAINDVAVPARFVPGQPDMWALVLFEALVFNGYFIVYMVCRVQNSELFLRSQAQLSPLWGTFNTLMLLISSWFMARCIQAAREQTYPVALKHAFLTILFGLIFFSSKVLEWYDEIQKGFVLTTDEFFSFYYFLTAIHVIHLLVGFVVLGIVVYQLWNPARRSQKIIETGATYWHMVDFLWIIIFALLYVMR